MKNHQQSNELILEFLARYVEKYPTQRLGQILYNLDIVRPVVTEGIVTAWQDDYNTPSIQILDRLNLDW